MLAVIAAAILAVMTAPPASEPISCPVDNNEGNVATNPEPVGTEMLTAEEAEIRDQAADQAASGGAAAFYYRQYLQAVPAYELGEPVDLDPGFYPGGITITIANIRYDESVDGDPVILADMRYENRTDVRYRTEAVLVCGPGSTPISTDGVQAFLLPESEVNIREMRARSFDEGTLMLSGAVAIRDRGVRRRRGLVESRTTARHSSISRPPWTLADL